ncbi:MAG: dihydrolipoyl dehydrogenase [Alphaproteobacteria bacterium]
MSKYDLVVIGTGPGGYVCAIRAAQLGMKVAVVERRATHGGTCLNVGCIPSKALLHASEAYAEAANHFAEMGIKVKPELDLAAMLAFKDAGVKGNVEGIEYLLKKNKIDAYHGMGRIIAPHRVEVTPDKGEPQTLETKAIVIATGSEVAHIHGIEVDEKRIVSSTGALSLPKVPKCMVVIGGGYIGLELGSVWSRLGAEVTVIEMLHTITPGLDGELAKQLQRSLQKQGLTFKLGTRVTKVDARGKTVKVTIEPVDRGKAETIETNVVLVSIGRVPNTDGLGLGDIGMELHSGGRIIVDRHFQTNIAGIYAIGDVIAGPMLAHKAEEEGIAVAEILAGQAGHVNYDVIPSVVYTAPEVASVGKTEEQLNQEGVHYKVGRFPFTANGRAKVNRTTEGFVKVLSDEATDRVLGVHIIGPDAGTMIAEAAVLMEFSGSAEDLARTCHAHPTLNEAVKEAALAVDKRPIHM